MTRSGAARTGLAILVVVSTLLVLTGTAVSSAAAQTSTISLEQELVDAYAPIVTIKSQPEECSNGGEQFRPVVVDILFGTDDVRLMQRGSGDKSTDIEIKRNITAADLAGLDDSFYLDLPGNPRNPDCDYERWGKARMAELGIEPSIYARVTTEPGQDGVVIQYWYYWVFNFFNNTHESDWEGIQLEFDSGSIEEILETRPLPSTIAFAQHDSGERAGPDDDKIDWDGTHIVAHPSSGSHADYYKSAVWLGWGENGSGFGCDYSDAPNEELPVSIVLIPTEIDPAGPFAWLTYEGRWGDRQEPSMFTGPTGPNMKPRWDTPIGWSSDLRGNSIPVPVKTTIGPGVSQVFCGVAQFGSTLVRAFPIDPKVVAGMLVALVGLFLMLAALAWRTIARAVRLYLKHGYFFITLGVVSFPIALVGQRLEDWIQDSIFHRIDPRLPDSAFTGSMLQYVFHAGLGGVQEIFLACIIGPIVIYATYQLMRNQSIGFQTSWREGLRLFPQVLGASFLIALMLTLMALTIVLIPLVINKGVQWFFAPEAVVVERANWRSARHVSSARIRGHWFRALAVGAAIAAISGLPGPIIGTVLMVLDYVGLDGAQWISGAVYCVLYPVSVMIATIFYIRLSTAPGTAEPYLAAPTVRTGEAPNLAPA